MYGGNEEKKGKVKIITVMRNSTLFGKMWLGKRKKQRERISEGVQKNRRIENFGEYEMRGRSFNQPDYVVPLAGWQPQSPLIHQAQLVASIVSDILSSFLSP